uniref:Uncharacterized protein n=1 Tax=Panagrolaimus sp. JU765 TaxID=591449 RepID=A0AC34PV67_9BILA
MPKATVEVRYEGNCFTDKMDFKLKDHHTFANVKEMVRYSLSPWFVFKKQYKVGIDGGNSLEEIEDDFKVEKDTNFVVLVAAPEEEEEPFLLAAAEQEEVAEEIETMKTNLWASLLDDNGQGQNVQNHSSKRQLSFSRDDDRTGNENGMDKGKEGMDDSGRGMDDSGRGMDDSLRGMIGSKRGMDESASGTTPSLFSSLLSDFESELDFTRQDVRDICHQFAEFTQCPDFDFGQTIEGNGAVESAVRSRKNRRRKSNGIVAKKKGQEYSNMEEIRTIAGKLSKLRDEELREAFSYSAVTRCDFVLHATEADLKSRGIAGAMYGLFPAIAGDISLLEQDFVVMMDDKGKLVPDFEEVMMKYCEAIHSVATRLKCETAYGRVYEDDSYRGALVELYNIIKKECRSNKMDASRLFIGGPLTNCLEEAMFQGSQTGWSHPRLLMVYNIPTYYYYIYMDGKAFKVCGGAFKALHWLYAVHQVFNVQYDKYSRQFYRFLERLAGVKSKNDTWTVTDNRIFSMLEDEINGASDVQVVEMVGNIMSARNTPIARKRKSTEGAADETPRVLKGIRKPFADINVNDDK